MLVWCSRPAAWASRRNRARLPCSGRNFSATWRLSEPWYASQTTPMPPRPSSRTIRNSPQVPRRRGHRPARPAARRPGQVAGESAPDRGAASAPRRPHRPSRRAVRSSARIRGRRRDARPRSPARRPGASPARNRRACPGSDSRCGSSAPRRAGPHAPGSVDGPRRTPVRWCLLDSAEYHSIIKSKYALECFMLTSVAMPRGHAPSSAVRALSLGSSDRARASGADARGPNEPGGDLRFESRRSDVLLLVAARPGARAGRLGAAREPVLPAGPPLVPASGDRRSTRSRTSRRRSSRRSPRASVNSGPISRGRRSAAGCAGSRGTSFSTTHATGASRPSAGRMPRSSSSRSPRRRTRSSSPKSPADVSGLYQRALRLVQHQVENRTWTAFWKATVESRPTAEVAAELGISPNAVRLAKSHVLRRLREEMGELIA